MLLRFEAVLNGKKFSDIAEELILVDINEDAAEVTVEKSARAVRDGTYVSSRRRASLSVVLRYVIRTQSITRRAEIKDAVAAWARKGGTLSINSRPGKTLSVEMDKPPALGSHLQWTDTMEMTLTAYAEPYWTQSATDTFDLAAGDDGEYYVNKVITVGGNAGDSTARIAIANASGTPLTHLRIECGDTYMEFADLPGTGEELISITYTNGVLTAKDLPTDTSLLPYRTPESSDELLAPCGMDVPFKALADAPLSGSVSIAARWM